MPIELQVQRSDAWVVAAVLPFMTEAAENAVLGSQAFARCIDRATGKVLATNEPRRAVENDDFGGCEKVRVLRLERPEALAQRHPDPFAASVKRVHVARPIHKAYAIDGWN